MDTVLFEKDLKKKIEHLFRADDCNIEFVSIELPPMSNHNKRFELEKDSIYYLASSELDIPVIASLYMSSENNFIATSKTEFEFDNNFKIECFRNYINVITENNISGKYTFKLKFLKVTPYRN